MIQTIQMFALGELELLCLDSLMLSCMLPSALLCAASSTRGLFGRPLLAQQLVAKLEGDGSTS